MAESIGWSRKHLARRFADEVGLAPKAVSRIVRFNRAIAAARNAGASWAGIAADCGYADQAHMVREFGQFAGRSPAAWPAAR
jgi:AraC-like DNA-binding protein